jgi:sec-independent protein translocase protein TatA
MFGLGIGELIVIPVIVIVIFGAGRIGDVGGDIGRAIRNFRKAMNEPDAIDVTPKDEEEGKKSADSESRKA